MSNRQQEDTEIRETEKRKFRFLCYLLLRNLLFNP